MPDFLLGVKHLRQTALILGLLVLSAIPNAAPAQQSTSAARSGLPLVPGARVRVKSSSLVAPLVANYLELRGDTLIVLEESAARGIWSFALDRVQLLETTAGDRRNHGPYMMRGALLGGAGGAIAGFVFAASVHPSDSTRKYSRPLTGLVGAAIGSGIGLIIGSRFAAERWTSVPLPSRTAVVPHPRGGITLIFSY